MRHEGAHYHLFPKATAAVPGREFYKGRVIIEGATDRNCMGKLEPVQKLAGNRRLRVPGGRFRFWQGGDGIFIIQARKDRNCDSCGQVIHGHKMNLPSYAAVGLPPIDHYVGLNYPGSCVRPYWGCEANICITCARKYLGSAKVYRCHDWQDGMGHWKVDSLPNVAKEPSLLFEDVLKQFLPPKAQGQLSD